MRNKSRTTLIFGTIVAILGIIISVLGAAFWTDFFQKWLRDPTDSTHWNIIEDGIMFTAIGMALITIGIIISIWGISFKINSDKK